MLSYLIYPYENCIPAHSDTLRRLHAQNKFTKLKFIGCKMLSHENILHA